MDNLSFRDEVLQELTTTIDQLLEVINGGVKYRALHHARLQKIHEEFLARYNSRDTDAMMEAIRKLEETSNKRRKASQDEEKRRRIQEHIFVGLVRNIRIRRNPQVAMKIMITLMENNDIRERLHQEMLAKYNFRDHHLSMEAIRQLEMEESRRRILQHILVDLVARSIKTRENSTMPQIMLTMLEHNDKRQKVHQQLMGKVHERVKRSHTRKILHQELIRKVQEDKQKNSFKKQLMEEILKKVEGRKKRFNAKKIFHQELIMKLLQKEILGIRCMLQSDQLEKPDIADAFLPRKLFFFGISTFTCQPKSSNCSSSTHLYEEIDNESDNCYCAVKPKGRSMKSRLKRFLGLK